MARSMVGQIAGLNLQRIDGQRLSDLNVRTFVLYDESAAFAPELRQRVPDALIVLRLLNGVNSHWDDPELTASAGAALCHQYPQVDLLCPANEQNYENQATSAAIAGWCNRFNDRWAAEGAPRKTVSPAISPGAPFSLSDLQVSWRRFDYIGVHGYATLADLGFSVALGLVDAHHRTWPGHPHLLTEFNVEKLEETTYRHAEGAAAVRSFLDNLSRLGYIRGAMWFLDDAWRDDQPYRMVRIPPLMDVYRQIGHEQSFTPQPEPPPSTNDPVPPAERAEITRLERLYNITHRDGQTIYLAGLEERTDPPNITAVSPPGVQVLISTNDNQHQVRGDGVVNMNFEHPAAYKPSAGERGAFYVEVGDARADGFGWARDDPPVLQGPHVNVVSRWARRSSIPPPVNPPDPGGPPQSMVINGYRVSFGFLDYYRQNTVSLGPPISPMVSSGQFGGEPTVPAERQRQVQYFQGGTLYYDGFNVRRL